jgi:dynein heavy chain
MVPVIQNQLDESSRLNIPTFTIPENVSIDCDSDMARLLEISVSDWKGVVLKRIDEEQSKHPDGQGPLAEVNFWRNRHAVFSELEEQVQGPAVQIILRKLRPVRNSLVQEADVLFQRLSRLAAEAADNAIFLATLERYFHILVDGSIPTITKSLPQLLDSLRLVWTISKHYNRVERFLPLMERISFQLTAKVRDSVDIKSILRYPSKKIVVDEAVNMLDTWHYVYMQVRKKISDEGLVHLRWEFDKSHIFDNTDYMAKVLREFGEISNKIGQFQRFLEPDISSIIGQSEDMHVIGLKVTSLLDTFASIMFDVYDKTQEDIWKSLVWKVGSMINNIDDANGACIEKAFHTQKSSEAALNHVENLQTFRCLEIHSSIERRFSNILELYTRELSEIQEVFQGSKSFPPISKTAPSSARAIAWCIRLYQKAKRPILRFACHEGMLTCPMGINVKRQYLSFARSLEAFKDMIFNNWEKGVASTVAEGLKRTVTIETDCVWPPFGSAPTVKLLTSNFSIQISTVIREAKYLSAQGLKIPDEALTVAFQEDTFHE